MGQNLSRDFGEVFGTGITRANLKSCKKFLCWTYLLHRLKVLNMIADLFKSLLDLPVLAHF